jgi:hypothetical protein
MRDIFEGDEFTDQYKQLTNQIRAALEPIFEKYQAQGQSQKGVGMAAIDVVYAMVPALADKAGPLKYER